MIKLLLARGTVLVISSFIAAAWTNQLLRLTDRAAEFVISQDELKALAEESRDQTQREAPLPAENDNELSQEPGDQETKRRQTQGGDAVPENPELARTVADTAASNAPAVAETADEGHALTKEPELEAEDSASQPPAAGLPQFHPSAAGSLTTFQGAGRGYSLAQDASAGYGPNTIWDVRLAGRPSIETLVNIRGTQLAAVRPLPGGAQIALVSATEIRGPISVAAFLHEFPRFQSGQGIILDRDLLGGVRDRLITYGSGWKLWLLIEDGVFAQWVRKVEQSLHEHARTWDDVQSVSGRVGLSAATNSPHFQLDDIEYDSDDAEAATRDARTERAAAASEQKSAGKEANASTPRRATKAANSE